MLQPPQKVRELLRARRLLEQHFDMMSHLRPESVGKEVWFVCGGLVTMTHHAGPQHVSPFPLRRSGPFPSVYSGQKLARLLTSVLAQELHAAWLLC